MSEYHWGYWPWEIVLDYTAGAGFCRHAVQIDDVTWRIPVVVRIHGACVCLQCATDAAEELGAFEDMH